MLVVAVLALWVAGSWNRWLRAALGGIGVGGLFIPATLFVFALKIRVIDGRIEADSVADLRLGEIAWSMFGAMGMFTPTGLRYLTPWPLIAVADANGVAGNPCAVQSTLMHHAVKCPPAECPASASFSRLRSRPQAAFHT